MCLIVVGIILVFLILVIAIAKANPSSSEFESPEKQAGIQGEKTAVKMIRSILSFEDYQFNNINISYNDKTTEIDNIIVNQYGVFIIEVKNYTGKIIGTEKDYNWQKYKTTNAGNTYFTTIDNPVKQVNRQIYILSHYLKEHGINVWKEGYILFLQNNSPIKNKMILHNKDEINNAVHTYSKKKLNSKTIESIIVTLSQK